MKKIMIGVLFVLLSLVLVACGAPQGVESNIGSGISSADIDTYAKEGEGGEGTIEIGADVTYDAYNLLTGEYTMASDLVGQRPIAVSVNNIEACWPQYGISEADIIYEIETEGGITRLMAVFSDIRNVSKVGSVRSLRDQFMQCVYPLDATIVHIGKSVYAKKYISMYNYQTIDADVVLSVFFTDDNRVAQGYAREHTKFTSGSAIYGAIDDLSFQTESYNENAAFNFVTPEETVVPTTGVANTVNYEFSYYYDGDFRYDGGWEPSGFTSSDLRTTVTKPAAPQLENTVYQMTGDTTASKEISQRLEISGSAGDTFVLAGWAKGDSVPLSVWLHGATEYTDQGRFFGLKATFHNDDETTTERTVSFNPDTQDYWQYAATPVVADKDYTAITVSAVYANNLNSACFDGIQLYKEQFGSSYTYDEDGNLISVVDLQKKNTTYEYESNNLTAILEDNKAKMRYEYDDYHNVIQAVTQKENEDGETVDGIVYEFVYDKWGNNEKVTICGEDATISSSAK